MTIPIQMEATNSSQMTTGFVRALRLDHRKQVANNRILPPQLRPTLN
jgi:hypothetical protein